MRENVERRFTCPLEDLRRRSGSWEREERTDVVNQKEREDRNHCVGIALM
jgi:hypothetical protein